VTRGAPVGGDVGSRGLRVVLLAAAVLAILSGPAAASASSGLTIDELDCEPSPAALQDIGTMAEQDGIAMDEAIARYGWQQCFSELVADVQASYPGSYAGAAIVDDGRRAWIAFTEPVPDDVVELAAQVPVPVQLLDDREVTEAELNEALQARYGEVAGHDDIVAASGSFDVETGVITIRAQPADRLSQAERDQLLATLRSTSASNPAIAFDVALVVELGGGDDEDAATRAHRSVPTAAVIGVLGVAAALGAVAVAMAARYRRRADLLSGDRDGGRLGT